MSSPPPPGKLLDAQTYANRHGEGRLTDQEEDFEAVCLRARQAHNLLVLQGLQPQRILEVGCGPHLLCQAARAAGLTVSQWVIVEPAERWAEAARQLQTTWPPLQVIGNYVEQAQAALAALAGGQAWADVVLVSGVVHETSEPLALLEAALRWLRPGGHALISVPNARSFHRLLAVAMGLMAEPRALSERNRLLGQAQVFDAERLQALAQAAGLQCLSLEGYLFKPFTHAQMACLMPMLGPQGEAGLVALGRQFPEHGAELALLGLKPANLLPPSP